MLPKKFITLVFIILFLTTYFPISKPVEAFGVEDLPFRQEIKIPIDTGKEEAKYQPIDIHVEFNHPCWAKNETVNSIRVCYDNGSGLTELESQIYELEFTDNSHIKACNLVFIIPKDANGRERYYILYDDSKTPPPNYPDHLKVEDDHYFYEPISGQKMNFDYYKITQDGYIIYGICQKGVLLGEGVSHTIIKLKPNSTTFESKNADQFASFAMSYAIDGPLQYSGTARAETVSKNILVDGNLMARVRIESISPEGNIKTNGIYTYYYSPSPYIKRIVAHVNHEVLKEIKVRGDKEKDGTYAGLSTFKSRSATINDMNVGNILPNLYIYGEDGSIKKYSIPTNPESHNPEWVLSTADDIDLGSKAWLCIDDSLTGKAHAFVFQSNTGLVKGNEDGIQVKASVKQVVKLPGLEADTGNLYATRNSYEKNGEHDLMLPEGMNVTFNAEFITFEKGGYKAVNKESEIFQNLAKERPLYKGNTSVKEKKQRYSLTTYVHFAPSFPLGSLLSAAVGKNFSYIYAELYKGNNLASSGSIARLPLSGKMELNLKNTTLIQKIKIILGLFDWRNMSFFKKITFPNLEKGKYMVKIYRENPFLGKERRYIGFGIVNLKGNNILHIECRPEGILEYHLTDQTGKGIKGVDALLIYDNTTVAQGSSDNNGSIIVKSPCLPLHPYTLRVIYNGFLVEEKKVRIGLKYHFKPMTGTFAIPLHQLKLSVKDKWDLPPEVDLHPTLTSNEMFESTSISTEKKGKGEYLFTGLYSADYVIGLSYKSFILKKNVTVNEDKVLELMFPAEFNVDFGFMNSCGIGLGDGKLIMSRDEKSIEKRIKNSDATVSVPPGLYDIKIFSDNNKVARQTVDVKGDKEVSIVTSHGSVIHETVFYIGIILSVTAVILMLWKRKFDIWLKLLTLAAVLVSAVSPWWLLTGNNSITETTTKTLLYPPKMITLTSSSSVSGGEVATVPDVFITILNLLFIILLVSSVLIILGMFLHKKRRLSFVCSIITIALLVFTVVLFFYAMSQITSIGVGSFLGNGDLEVTLPDEEKSITLPCSWGPSIGFYLAVIAAVFMSVSVYTYAKGKSTKHAVFLVKYGKL